MLCTPGLPIHSGSPESDNPIRDSLLDHVVRNPEELAFGVWDELKFRSCRRAWLLAMALHIRRLEQGKWPASRAELEPDVDWPVDAETGRSMIYVPGGRDEWERVQPDLNLLQRDTPHSYHVWYIDRTQFEERSLSRSTPFLWSDSTGPFMLAPHPPEHPGEGQ